MVAFAVNLEAREISILGLFYGGQNYEALFHDGAEIENEDL